jgi:predicted O-methyltransferase YrrM
MISSTDVVAAPENRAVLHLARWVGRRQYRRMLKDDLPNPLRLPIEFLLSGELDPGDEQVSARIETLRSQLAKRQNERVTVFSGMTVNEYGSYLFPHGGTLERSLAQIAYESSVLPRWGMFLYLCAKAAGAKTVLELGSSAGISGCYLASTPECQRFITIEGSSELAKLAESNLSGIVRNFEVVNASFDKALDRIGPTLGHGLDMVFLDGDKRKASLCGSFRRLVSHLNRGSMVVFDDIYWSSEMWQAWQMLRRWKGFSHAVTAGRFGVCFWTGDRTEPKTFNLYQFAGLDLYKLKQRVENWRRRPLRLSAVRKFGS